MSRVHLSVVGQAPVVEGPFGCDYAWATDGASYRVLVHRYAPGSDSSYAAWQAFDACDDDGADEDERGAR